jgi:hypothetical protein
MAWFNLFNKPIVVHCYTDRADVFNYAPIEKAVKFVPKVWKQIPKTVIPEGSVKHSATMKSCAGFIDLYKSGFIVPMWCDLDLEIGKIGSGYHSYQYSDGQSIAQAHPQFQRGNMYPEEKYQHIQLHNPWVFYCDKDIDFVLTEPTWNIDSPEVVKILPGILNFKYQSGCNINMIWTRQVNKTFYTVDFNQPIAHLIPVTEKKVELKMHLVSSEKFRALGSRISGIKFINKYATAKKIMQERGCPFHFKPEK